MPCFSLLLLPTERRLKSQAKALYLLLLLLSLSLSLLLLFSLSSVLNWAAMEIGGGSWRRVSRETSPERSRLGGSARQDFTNRSARSTTAAEAVRKVQVVYYLSKNGQLEHPHFMELTHLPTQQLRLKDVMERLTVLRGKGMRGLFSWSCKRSYKNGYVWNDLSENDVIYPADGVEYVLKGSEIIHGGGVSTSERLQQIQTSPRALPVALVDRGDEEDEDYTEDEKPGSNLIGAELPRRSRAALPKVNATVISRAATAAKEELALDDASPPSSSSSDHHSVDPGAATATGTRSSVLLQLISCGSFTVKNGRAPRSGGVVLQRGLVGRLASAAAAPARSSGGDVEDHVRDVRYMSENPRFGNLQAEEKEYFSGSIVEALAETSRVGPATLKKSSSFNEERGSRLVEREVAAAAAAATNGDDKEGGGGGGDGRVRGRCIPGRSWRSNGKQ